MGDRDILRLFQVLRSFQQEFKRAHTHTRTRTHTHTHTHKHTHTALKLVQDLYFGYHCASSSTSNQCFGPCLSLCAMCSRNAAIGRLRMVIFTNQKFSFCVSGCCINFLFAYICVGFSTQVS